MFQKSNFSFRQFVSAYKEQVYSTYSFLRSANFRFPSPEWSLRFLTIIIFDFFTKNFFQVISSLCSADIADLKILQSDWLKAF